MSQKKKKKKKNDAFEQNYAYVTTLLINKYFFH